MINKKVKTAKIFALALCLNSTSAYVYGMDEHSLSAPDHASASSATKFCEIFSEIDEELARLYPGTLTDFEKVHNSIPSSFSATACDLRSATSENFIAANEYYFRIFF